MTDNTMELLTDFRSEIPLPDHEATRSAYERIVTTMSAQRHLLTRLIGRKRLTLALAAGALILAAASVAAIKEAPWWQSGAPPVDPQEVVSVASDNLPASVDVARARTVVTTGDAALVAVPLNSTGYCLIPALDGRATLGAQCEYQVKNPQNGDDDRTISATRRANGERSAAWIVYGRITDPRAAKFDLGAFTLDLASGGFFLGQVPQAQWSQLSGSATSGTILDSSGGVLRRGCVNWASAPTGTGADGEYPLPLWSEQGGTTCKRQKPPVQPTVDLGAAKKVFDVTLTQNYSLWKAGQTITFEAAPRSDGRTCLVASGPGTPGAARGYNFTNSCAAASGQANLKQPINVGTGASLTHVDGKAIYVWDISGAVDPGSGITKLELRSGASTTPVSFGGGFFFAQLPATSPGPQKGTVSMPPGEWLLVGLDATGHQVAEVDLVAAHRHASPH
jgi:hypothetical protein